MKTKVLIASLMAIVMGLIVSCKQEEPTETDMKNYIEALKAYYPYSQGESVSFWNEDLERQWNLNANACNSHIIICKNEPGSKCSGDRSATISTSFEEGGINSNKEIVSEIGTLLEHEGGSKTVFIRWDMSLRLSKEEYYQGSASVTCPTENVLAQFTDTIIVQITGKRSASGDMESAPKGAYAHIVKGKGMTDFSLDDRTVWKRVKVE